MDYKTFKHVPGLVVHTKNGETEEDLKQVEEFVGSGKAYAKTTQGGTFIALDSDSVPVAEKKTDIVLSENLLADNVLLEHLPRCNLHPRPNETIREVVGIFGESGSGKSTYADKYAALFIKMNPKSRVYIISEIHDGYERVQEAAPKAVSRIRVTPGIVPGYEDELKAEEILEKLKKLRGRNFQNCLVIFDDIEQSLGNIKNEIYRIRDELLTTGRHNNVFLCIIEHLIFKYTWSRTLLQECTSLTVFPGAGDYHILRYFATRLSINQNSPILARIFEPQLPAYNWVTVFPQIPKKILKPTETWLLHPCFNARYQFFNQVRPFENEVDNEHWMRTSKKKEQLLKRKIEHPITVPFVLDYVDDQSTATSSSSSSTSTEPETTSDDLLYEIMDQERHSQSGKKRKV